MKSSEGNASLEMIVLKQVAMVISIFMASSNSVYAPEVEALDNPGDWILEEVSGVGKLPDLNSFPYFRTSIALDSKDMPHIAYLSVETREVNYAYIDTDDKWHVENVVSAEIKGGFASLVIDSNDRPMICYLNYTLRGLSCASKGVSGWTHEIVDGSSDAGVLSSLTLDSLDRPHLAYKNFKSDLKYAWRNGTSWNITNLRDWISGSLTGISLDLDSRDSPHIAFSATDDKRGVWHYRWNKTHWDKEVVDTSYLSVAMSMAIDAAGSPHLLYRDHARGAHRYAYNNGTSWTYSYIDLGVKVRYGSLSLDSEQSPHVVYEVYEDYRDHELRYAYLENGSWKTEIVDSEGYVGLQPSLAMDSNDIPSVSYVDHTDGFLMYATKKKMIEAEIDIDPDTLNLRSNGKWITCYIELPSGYDPRDVNASTILLEEVLQPELNPKYGFVKSEESYIVDHDGDGILERMVKFDRQKVVELSSPGDVVLLNVTGQLYDGTRFDGTDTIRIINQPSIQTSVPDASESERYERPKDTHRIGGVGVGHLNFLARDIKPFTVSIMQ